MSSAGKPPGKGGSGGGRRRNRNHSRRRNRARRRKDKAQQALEPESKEPEPQEPEPEPQEPEAHNFEGFRQPAAELLEEFHEFEALQANHPDPALALERKRAFLCMAGFDPDKVAAMELRMVRLCIFLLRKRSEDRETVTKQHHRALERQRYTDRRRAREQAPERPSDFSLSPSGMELLAGLHFVGADVSAMILGLERQERDHSDWQRAMHGVGVELHQVMQLHAGPDGRGQRLISRNGLAVGASNMSFYFGRLGNYQSLCLTDFVFTMLLPEDDLEDQSRPLHETLQTLCKYELRNGADMSLNWR